MTMKMLAVQVVETSVTDDTTLQEFSLMIRMITFQSRYVASEFKPFAIKPAPASLPWLK